MFELLIGYTAFALLGVTTLPLDPDGFMPFQDNYYRGR
jgi:hypothetical protein